jgi:hypothetical protein
MLAVVTAPLMGDGDGPVVAGGIVYQLGSQGPLPQLWACLLLAA